MNSNSNRTTSSSSSNNNSPSNRRNSHNNNNNSSTTTTATSQVYYEEVLNTAAALALQHRSNSHSNTHNDDTQQQQQQQQRKLNRFDPYSYNHQSDDTENTRSIETISKMNNISTNSSYSTTSSASPTRSFIKSPSQNSTSANNHNSNNNIMSMSDEDALILSSLPKQPISNFPNESDRKRIIGCLASILSRMYDYENYGLLNYTSYNHGDNDYDDDNNDINAKGERTQIQLESIENDKFTVVPVESMEYNVDDMDEIDVNQDDEPTSTPFGGKKIHKGLPVTKSLPSPDKKKKASPSKQNQSNNTNNRRNRASKSAIFEQEQYRRRRHEVYCSFLVFAADLLLLDKSNAVAFLPLLGSMLGEDKDKPPIKNNNQSVKNATGNDIVPPSTAASGRLENKNRNKNNSEESRKSEPELILRGWTHDEEEASIGLSPAPSTDSYYNHSNHRNGASPQVETSIPDKESKKSKKDTWDNNDILIPFVESLSPGAGFQCLALLLTNYLLRSQVGYDARIRHILKKLGIVLISHDMKTSGDYENKNDDYLARLATRKYEALEDAVALKLLKLSAAQEKEAALEGKKADNTTDSDTKRSLIRKRIVTGLKVGSAGIAAGTLFAVTGGLAAPGIAAGLAASGLTATAAAASIVTTLTSTAAVTTIFGIGGGSLAAYKTHRRVKGITEFVVIKEERRRASRDDTEIVDGNLFSTICISGWLTDEKDFQRPWGVEPTNPPVSDWTEKLIRFYAIYNPDYVSRSQDILKRWKGEERQLWAILRKKYGRDPDHLYPLQNYPHRRLPISFFESEVIDNLLTELGYVVNNEESLENLDDRYGMLNINMSSSDADDTLSTTPSMLRQYSERKSFISGISDSFEDDIPKNGDRELKSNKHIQQIWDYKGEYGGELLTVRWESDLLVELCDSVTDMAVDMVGTAAREILKQTALSTLITAIAWPYGLVRAASMIDSTWTLAIERADLAGIELARRLLESKAGNRPVVLVGFSMGARTVYSCLKELARHQLEWEERRKSLNKDRKFAELREPASIIEDAIMMGLPNHLSLPSWVSCRSVVAGRLVNCYSGKDLILSLMFQLNRLSGVLRPVCGTSPVNVAGVENYDVSNFISGHSDYCKRTGHILRMINHGCPYRPNVVITIPREFANIAL